MTQIEHRRIATPAGVLTDDPDWPELRTLPTFGDDLAAGEIIALSPRHQKLSFHWELMDGMGDAALPIVGTGSATISVEVITRYRVRGFDSYKRYGVKLTQSPQVALEQTGMSEQGVSWLRVTTGASLGAAEAVWIFFDTSDDG
jgi:hypothetical protein